MKVKHENLVLFQHLIISNFGKDIGEIVIPMYKTLASVSNLVQLEYKGLIISMREYLSDNVIVLRCCKDNCLLTLTISNECPSLEIVDVNSQHSMIDDVDEFERWCDENDLR